MNMRERCERAEAYRKNGANCAQALLAAFADVMGITETQALAVGAGLGGGVRSGEHLWGGKRAGDDPGLRVSGNGRQQGEIRGDHQGIPAAVYGEI